MTLVDGVTAPVPGVVGVALGHVADTAAREGLHGGDAVGEDPVTAGIGSEADDLPGVETGGVAGVSPASITRSPVLIVGAIDPERTLMTG